MGAGINDLDVPSIPEIPGAPNLSMGWAAKGSQPGHTGEAVNLIFLNIILEFYSNRLLKNYSEMIAINE